MVDVANESEIVPIRNIHWSKQIETVVAQEGEKCRGLAWLHQHSEERYTRYNNNIQIPSIVLSTLTGATSLSSTALFGEENGPTASKFLGFVSIGVGIINTLGNYFSFARKSEAHHIAYLNYSKLFTMVRIELALPVDERTDADNLLKTLRKEMDHLAEITPLPPKQILDDFVKKFKDYTDVSKPSETNGLAKIDIFTELPKKSNIGRNNTTGILLSSSTVTPRQSSTPPIITRQATPEPRTDETV
jgi:hypothetical protein